MSSDTGNVARLNKADLATILADVFAPWVQDLDITIDDVAHDGLTTRMPASARLSRIGNIVSGQAITAMADTTMVLALAAKFGEFRPVVTVDLSMTFMRAISSSHVLCEARVRRAGRALAFVCAELRAADDPQVAAVANGTFAIPEASKHDAKMVVS